MSTCHVCGVGKPERPTAAHPICHPCRCALDRYGERTHEELHTIERVSRMHLHESIVKLRRVHAKRNGIASLGRYIPLPEHRGAI